MPALDELDVSQLDLDTSKDELMLAAAHHDLPTLRTLLRSESVKVQDQDTGYTPMHAAIAACKSEDAPPSPALTNGQANSTDAVEDNETVEHREMIELAAKTLRILFQNGAMWDDLDNNDETPGCLAWRLGLKPLYEVVVDAGVRVELLLNRRDEYQQLSDMDEEDGEAEEPTNAAENAQPDTYAITSNLNDLSSGLSFPNIRLQYGHNNIATTDWQTTILRRTAARLLPLTGLRVLTIGYGNGAFDRFVQEHNPSSHHIIENKPSILAQMRTDGWLLPSASSSTEPKYSNVTVHQGRWQDVVEELSRTNITFDAVFFDTCAEPYATFHEFFTNSLAAILREGAAWSFFHGLGLERRVYYDVYTKVLEMDIFEAGFDVEWEVVEMPLLEEGVRRDWDVQSYRLPVCRSVE